MDNNNEWVGDDNWQPVLKPHPLPKILLRVLAGLTVFYLIYVFYLQYLSDAYLNIRCVFIAIPTDKCDDVDSPTIIQIAEIVVLFILYLSAPFLSLIAQLHHLIIWIRPSSVLLLPKNVKWMHRILYFTLIDVTFRMTIIACQEMMFISINNPTSEEENSLMTYVSASVRAIWCFTLLVHFALYSRMTVLDQDIAFRLLAD